MWNLALLAALGQALDFKYSLAPGARFCFSQFLYVGEPVKVKVEAPSENVIFSVKDDHSQTPLQTKAGSLTMNAYAGHSGQFTLCAESRHRDNQLIDIKYQHGVELHDSTNLAGVSQKIFLSQEISELSRVVDQFSMIIELKQTYVEKAGQLNEALGQKAIVFSVLGLVLLLLTGYCQFSQIRRLLRIRKVI